MVDEASGADLRDEDAPQVRTRVRIVAAAAKLIAEGGRDAVTTRAVSASADVQAPTIYRLFGDKRGLLEAVAEFGFAAYLAEKGAWVLGPDPVENLRAGWDLHVGFGLANPAIFSIMYGEPQVGVRTSAEAVALEMLRAHIRQVAVAGRLRVHEDRAVELVRAAGCGTVFTLLSMPEQRRDLTLSELARDAVFAAILTDTAAVGSTGPAAAAITLRAVLPEVEGLSGGERQLMGEWLDRLSGDPG